MKARYFAAAIVGLMLASCVSISDYKKLQNEVNALKAASTEKLTVLEYDISRFKEAYNPDLHLRLNENLDESARYYSRIQEISKAMENVEKEARILLMNSQMDRNIVAENARSSISQNVVNEFNSLRTKWDIALSDLIKLSINSSESANRAQIEAAKAGDKAVAAEKAAGKAAENSQIALAINKNLIDLGNRIAQIEALIKQMQVAYPAIDTENKKDIEILNNYYKSINSRILEMEKALQELYKTNKS
jgi:hypothetical protein